MKTTTNYGFKQPEGTDIVNIDDISDNFGSVDTEIKKANDKVVAHEGKGGTVHADVTTTTSGFMSASDKTKLNGIATGAQTNQNAVQSIQVVTPTGTVVGTATAANTTDTIQLKEGNDIDIAVSGKVVTVNNTYSYTHPLGDGNLHVPATGTTNSGKVLKAGATAGSLVWGTLTPTDVGALPTSHEGQGGSVHADVTTSTSGFMSAADKTKLNGIATGAQTNQNAVQSIQAVTSSGTAIGTATAASATDTIQLKEGSNIDIAVSGKTLTLNNTYSYTHPASDGNLHVPATGTSNNGKVLKAGSTAGSLAWGTLTSADVGALPTSHQGQGGSVHADVSTSASGFMSAADKTKLNGIAAGAQANQNAVQSIQAVTSSGAAIGTATASNATDTIQLKEGNNISITASGKALTLNNTYSYTHPTGDGNVHVPATGTTNNGKVLKAGSTAGSLAWGELKAQDIKNSVGNSVEDEIENSKISGFYRQAIINGNFDVWQRGISFNTGSYNADRWALWYDGAMAVTVSKQEFIKGQNEVPNNPKNFLRIQAASASGQTTSNICQAIEGGCRLFSEKKVTLSFYAKSNIARNISTSLKQYFGSGGNPSSTVMLSSQTIALTTAWKKFTLTFTLPTVSGKVFGTNDDEYLQVCINMPLNTSFTFDLAQVQLNVGEIALPFIPKTFEEELLNCMRFYEKSYPYNKYAASGTSEGEYNLSLGSNNAGQFVATVLFKVPKRIKPTVSLYAFNGAQNVWYIEKSGYIGTATAIANVYTEKQFTLVVPQATTAYSAGLIAGQWIADAEL